MPVARSIVIIDDDPDILRLFTLLFETAGYKVLAAPTATDGLAYLATADPVAVLCDVRMPGMDGVDFCTLVRTSPTLRQPPIILTSAALLPPHSLPADITFLPKPISVPTLLAAVGRHAMAV
ncbi:MAG TPA: response regulator [Herpetosiphonaceae bacterium]